MIETEQMDQPMNEQSFDLNVQRMSSFIRLACGNRNGDHDIAEHVWLDMGELPLTQRERQDVRGTVLASPGVIEASHGPVADEQDAQFGIRKTETPQQLREPFQERRSWQPSFPDGVFYPDVHCVSCLL